MAKKRQLEGMVIGEHAGTAFWGEGLGIEHRERFAEGIRIEMTDKWALLHLATGEVVTQPPAQASGTMVEQGMRLYRQLNSGGTQ